MYFLIKTTVIISLIVAVLTLLPALTIPHQIVSSLATVFTYAYQWNHVIDIDTLILVFWLTLFTEGIYLGWRATKWVLELVAQ